MFTNPKYTLVLMNLLGLTPEEFQAVHHHGPKADLQAHRDYCAKTKMFQANGANAQTAMKLENLLVDRIRSLAV